MCRCMNLFVSVLFVRLSKILEIDILYICSQGQEDGFEPYELIGAAPSLSQTTDFLDDDFVF